MIELQPGEHFGLDGMGWPPATLVRDPSSGRYYVERPLDGSRREVDAIEADRLMTPDE